MKEQTAILTGYVYHIKDLYFDIAKDGMLMQNHEGGAYRPTYLCIQDDMTNIHWAIPMSSRIEKYKKIVDKDTEKFGRCVKICIARYGEKDSAFLLQNMFPITSTYIDHIHTIAGIPVSVDKKVTNEVMRTFKECLRLHRRGAKVIFTDIDRLERLMLSELQKKESSVTKPAPSITERLQAATAEVERREQQREGTTKPRNPER